MIGITCSTPAIACKGSGMQLVLVADDADDGAMLALADVRLEAELVDAVEDVIDLGLGGVLAQDNDHRRCLG